MADDAPRETTRQTFSPIKTDLSKPSVTGVGTATQLLKELNAIADEENTRQQAWPKSPHGLGGILKRLAPNLRSKGVNFSKSRATDRSGSRLIRLEEMGISSSALSDCQNSGETPTNLDLASDNQPSADNQSDNVPSALSELQAHNIGLSDGLTTSDNLLQEFSDTQESASTADTRQLAFEMDDEMLASSQKKPL